MAAPSATDLRDHAEAAVGALAVGARLTPALPAGWPDARGRVVYLVCKRDTLPTSLDTALVHAPSDEVEVEVKSGAARRVKLPARPPLGEETRSGIDGGPPSGDELAQAEQVLVDVVAGRRPAAGAKEDLATYARWLESEERLAAELRARFGAFFGWLSS